MLVTNVSEKEPEQSLDGVRSQEWNLIYRDDDAMREIAPLNGGPIRDRFAESRRDWSQPLPGSQEEAPKMVGEDNTAIRTRGRRGILNSLQSAVSGRQEEDDPAGELPAGRA